MSDEVLSWWQDVVDDLDDDSTTVTVTMSRVMVYRTLWALMASGGEDRRH